MELTITTDTSVSKMDNFTNYLSVITKEDALESVRRLTQMESEDWFRVGMILSSYKKSKGETELKELIAYTSDNFQINSRKAFYLINIYDRLVASNITPDKVSEVGWTKLKEIADLLTIDNVDYWVDICKKNTTQQLIALLKSSGTTNEKKANIISDVLDSAGIITDTKENTKVEPTVLETDTGIIDTDAIMVEDGVASNTISSSDSKEYLGYITDCEVSNYVKYQANVIPTDSTYSENSLDIVEGVILSETTEKESTKETIIQNVELVDSSIPMMELISRLKDYDLSLVLKTVTDIFPNIKIIVTEPQDETSFD